MEYFQLDGEALTHIAMMTQDHYSVKLGINSDLGCTASTQFICSHSLIVQMQDDVSMFVFISDEVTANMTLVEESLTAKFVQDLSMTLQPVKVALKLISKSSATPLTCCLCSLTRVSTHSSHFIRSLNCCLPPPLITLHFSHLADALPCSSQPLGPIKQKTLGLK
ncbi:unnamed protein product [Coregonus sp. 'balchen']|nr:unnamed protein product [Coregonus sp. 'balchen']